MGLTGDASLYWQMIQQVAQLEWHMLPEYPELTFAQMLEAVGVLRDKLKGQGSHSNAYAVKAAWVVQTFALRVGLPDRPVFGASAKPDALAVAQLDDFLATHSGFAGVVDEKAIPWQELIQLLPVLLDLIRRFWGK